MILGLALAASVAHAQPRSDEAQDVIDMIGEEALIPNMPPGPPPSSVAEIEARTYDITARLRCPVCQGLSVAASTTDAAVMMQRRVRELVEVGYSDDQILDFFVVRYSEWILLDPPAEGLGMLLWVVPGLLAGLGVAWALGTAVVWRKEPDQVPLPSDLGLTNRDPYEERLLRELED